MTAGFDSVEQLVRHRLAEALGGKRGIVESAVPTALFTVLWLISQDLRLSLTVSFGATALLLVVRVIQRSNVQFVFNALVGIGIAAIFASRSGEARDVFLPGILYNAGYAVAFIISIVVGWPIVGFMIGAITGDATSWHKDKALVSLCVKLSWLFAVPCLIRVAIQYPLWATDQVGWLGASKLALGWPLQLASFAAMAWVLSRNKTPMSTDADVIADADPDPRAG